MLQLHLSDEQFYCQLRVFVYLQFLNFRYSSLISSTDLNKKAATLPAKKSNPLHVMRSNSAAYSDSPQESPFHGKNHANIYSLYGLYGPWCPLSPKRPLKLITHSLMQICDWNIKGPISPALNLPLLAVFLRFFSKCLKKKNRLKKKAARGVRFKSGPRFSVWDLHQICK